MAHTSSMPIGCAVPASGTGSCFIHPPLLSAWVPNSPAGCCSQPFSSVAVTDFMSWQPHANGVVDQLAQDQIPPVVSVPFPFQATSDDLPASFSRKRKSTDFVSDYVKPAKVFINEEKMSAKMSGLHLDNNNIDRHPDLEQQPWYSQQISSSATVSMPENEIISKPPLTKTLHENARLELCSELELGLKTRELLPKVFLDELNKPSMQLVLWQPPGDFVRAVVKELAEGNAEKEREMDNDTVEQHESRYLGESMTGHEEAADNVEFYEIQTNEMDL